MSAPRIPPQHNLRPDPFRQVGQGAIGRAVRVLALRRLLQAFWPFALVLKLFLIAALLGLFPLLGPLGHTLLAVVFAIALAGSLVFSIRRYRGTSEGEARRAVERASGLLHRPLTALADRAAVDGGLWAQHRARAADTIKTVALHAPRLSLAGLGSPVLRYGSWALLVVALLFAWDEAPRRLEEATEPPLSRLLPVARLDAWVTPPAYTGQPPLALRADQSGLTVPEGSTITVRVTGGWFPPVVELPAGRQRLVLDAGQTYQATAPILQSGYMKIRQDGRYLGQWHISLLRDTPPVIAFDKPPAPTDQMALRLDYTASDDVGLARIEAAIEPALVEANSPHREPLVLPLPLASPPPLRASGFRYFDLTAHPLAGTNVLITLRAVDGKGQVSETTPVPFVLPERSFSNPIAKALIKLRKELLVRGLAARHPGIELVSGLAEEVEEGERADFLGSLALRVIAARFRLSNDPQVIPGLERLMWDTALHFEDGGAGQALNQLRQAQQALEDALSNGASDAEVQSLMQQLQQAMNDYLDQLQQQGQPGDQPMQGQVGQTIDRQDLQNMIEQMRQLAQSGSRDQARQMLSQLQQLMENMRTQGSGRPDPELARAMERLGDIAKEQQQMMQSRPEQGQSQSPQQPAQQQEGLRHDLGDVMQGLAERGLDVNELGHGERAMKDARESLEQGESQAAAQQQGEALRHVQQGMQSLQQQMQQRQGQSGGDPFGRRPDGDSGTDTSKIEIPDRQAADRARQVLEELRRRSGDYSRPPEERQYLDRLLKWF